MPDAGLIDIISSAGPVGMLAIFIVALLRRWIVLPREVEREQERVQELTRERDEYKQLAFDALQVGERVVRVAEKKGI